MSSNRTALLWRLAERTPEPLLRGLLQSGGYLTWLKRNKGVRQLERNLARIRPELSTKELRRLSRQAMRSYMRYYSEVFKMRSLSADQIRARVRCSGYENIAPLLQSHQSVPMALSHQGNWDLAGAYAGLEIAPVTTVAERLEPAELFQQFLDFRQSLGMKIHALGDEGVFAALLRQTRTGPGIIPLLADRDLSASGVEVELFGLQARVAPGPAALSVASGVPLVPLGIYYEKLSTSRRREAKSPWGIVLHFYPGLEPNRELPRKEQVAELTQRWVLALEDSIRSFPQDWHMLQKVFISDLDPQRYTQVTQTGAPSE